MTFLVAVTKTPTESKVDGGGGGLSADWATGLGYAALLQKHHVTSDIVSAGRKQSDGC